MTTTGFAGGCVFVRILLPDLLPEGVARAGQSGEGDEENACPKVDIVAGGVVGGVQSANHTEGSLGLSVVKMDGHGVLAQLQGFQVCSLQGNYGAALLDGVIAVADARAVNGHAYKLGVVAAGGKAQSLGALLIPLAVVACLLYTSPSPRD